ncbi:HNH endonuclease [Mycobacterium sp. Root135]|uniref:hypothetical protein n=1 Tax=Mycobacterium sp. Root135 TaxID=1736457 RepID=UPI0006F5ECA9|nr:hypothetical protein [Mycobacterium sp. Root135]KQY03258.1 HNH endonuclease [Mycobacterium sp. Root135]
MFDAMDEAGLIDRIAVLERAKSTAAAEQAVLTAHLDTTRRAREAAAGIPTAKRGKGLGSEIALARRDSPNRGGRHLGFARALVNDMPHTLAALKAGLLSEWRATLIVRESACLDLADRRLLDARMCADQNSLEGKGDKRIEADAKAIAYELDPHAVVDRAARAETDRVYAALRREADTCGDGRPRNHVMADTLVERITGRPADIPVPIAVDLVITDDTLLGGDQAAARVPGYGPIPAAVARRLVNRAATDARSQATLRRLYRHPDSGALIAMESRARAFPKGLTRFITVRDDTCRTPYCDAPIRHTDHAVDHATGGPTTAVNGRGTCAGCNYDKQAPGWKVSNHRDRDGTHTCEIVTPTGARHHSTAPPLPGRPGHRRSIVEVAFADELAWHNAA